MPSILILMTLYLQEIEPAAFSKNTFLSHHSIQQRLLLNFSIQNFNMPLILILLFQKMALYLQEIGPEAFSNNTFLDHHSIQQRQLQNFSIQNFNMPLILILLLKKMTLYLHKQSLQLSAKTPFLITIQFNSAY